MKKIFLLLLILLSSSLLAQIGGDAVYKFLNLSISAKQSALGGKVYTGLKGDIFQPAFNPATIDSTLNNKFGINYVSYLSDINYGNIAYARKIKKLGTFYAAVSYVNYGQFEYAGEDGTRNGTFGASENALIFGYAYTIPETKWKVGINTKFIFSAFENYASTGLALDFGLSYDNRKQGIQSALVFRNFGTQLSTYQGTKENLPFEIDASFSKTFLHAPFKWFVTLENLQKPKIAFVNTAHNTQDPNGLVIEENISIVDHIFRHIIIGVELFPRKRFNLRAGYNFRRAAELGLKDQNFSSGFSAGFGLRLRKFEINYGYGGYSFASNANYFSIIVNLNEF
jgi:hypothetical protein